MFKLLKTHKFSKSATKVFENKDLLNIILDYADEITPNQRINHSNIMSLFHNSDYLRLDLTPTACYLEINSFLLDNAFYRCAVCCCKTNHWWNKNYGMNNLRNICYDCATPFLKTLSFI